MNYFLTGLMVLIGSLCFAQNKSFSISGTIQSEENFPLESATIYLERIKDSTLLTYTITDKNGQFYIEDKTADERLQLNVSYVGFQTFQQNIQINKEEIDLGIFRMSKGETLEAVLLKSRAPITVKKDTLEFNVKSFKTRKDATVEDLLKELPGVEVDEDGTITVNGKEVNKILVNGKPFFGDDPTITTRNLTKEIIEKVQVTDTKTDAEAFAGESSDGQDKTINLTIKEENNKGVFGRVAGGLGTDDRYEFAGFFNRFDNDQRFSVLAGGNNINSAGFSFGEIRKMFGGGNNVYMTGNGSFGIDGRSFGGGDGIVISRNAGANFTDEFGEKLDLTADYFYSASDGEDRTTTERENILPDSRFFTSSSSGSRTESDNHVANLQFNVKLDSTFLINIKPGLVYSKAKRNFNQTESSSDETGAVLNEGSSNSFSEFTSKGFENDLDVTKKIGGNGSYVKLSLSNEFKTDTGDDFLDSETLLFGDMPETTLRNQFTSSELKLNSFFAKATYRYPLLAKKLFLDLDFSHRDDTRKNVENTFDFDEGTQDFTTFNTALSTNFEYTNMRSTPSVGLNYNNDKMRANFKLGYVFRTLSNEDALRPETSFEQSFEAVELNSYVNYRFSPKSSVYFNYNLNNTPPEISQIQPFQDVSDPLNITTGNPNLEPANSHRLYVGYNAFDFQKGTGFNVYAGGNLTNNAVVANTVVDENLVRNTTYTNVDGNYWSYVSARYSKDIKIDSVTKLKYRLGLSYNGNRDVNFNNNEEYAATTQSFTPNVRFTLNWRKWVELIPEYRVAFSKTKYDLDGFDDREFLRHTLGIRTATFLPKKLEWRNDISYNYNPNVAPGFQKSAWFWNTTFAYSVLKDQGTLTLKVYDLLNQNTNARRTATQSYIQDSESLVLRQYAMLSFSWKFNSLGPKGETDDGGMFFFD